MTIECMIPDCTREAVTRGLCWPCYQLARRLVITNQTSWDELVERGLVKSATRGRDKLASFTKAFEESKESSPNS